MLVRIAALIIDKNRPVERKTFDIRHFRMPPLRYFNQRLPAVTGNMRATELSVPGEASSPGVPPNSVDFYLL